MSDLNQLKQASDVIRQKCKQAGIEGKIDSLVVLGSGLGPFADTLPNSVVIPYREIPHFKETSVSGHTGELVITEINSKVVAFQKGRLHYYEGHTYDEINFPLRTAKLMGASLLLLTNAAGSLNIDFNPGDLVLIKDHINFSGNNPLIGKNIPEIGPRFPDMTEVYTKSHREDFKKFATQLEIPLKEGTYLHVSGPSYETPSEIRFFQMIGGDMVGMSTVPEAIAGKHCGMNVVGLSCITNYGAGIKPEPLKHEDVKEEAMKAMNKFSKLLKIFLENS